MPAIEAVANLTGNGIDLVVPMVIGLSGGKIPGLAGLKPDGTPVEVDLEPMLDAPLKVNAALTKTDLVIGTPSYNVKSIISNDRKPHNTFIDFTMGAGFYKSVLKSSFEET